MIIAKILVIFYIFYILEKSESLKRLKSREKYIIYVSIVLLGLANTQITMFNYSFDFLIIGIIISLIEIILKNLKIITNYLFLKIYLVILFVLLLYRGGLWILKYL